MNSIWISLLWKEWCEFRWKLVALVPILGVVPLLALWGFAGGGDTDKVLILTILPAMSTIPYVVIAGLFVAMSVAAGESSRRTIRFLQALPIPMWKAALVKLLTAAVTVIVPIVVIVGMVWLVVDHLDPTGELQVKASRQLVRESGWGIENYYLWQITTGVVGTASLLVWGAAAGANRSDEVRAGAVAFLVVTGVWLLYAAGLWIIDRLMGSNPDSANLLIAALPGGLANYSRDVIHESLGNQIAFWCIGVTSHATVLVWFLTQFGRVPVPPKRGVAGEWNFAFWRATNSLPLRTPLGAIIWKQTREIGPLALFAVVGVVAFTFLVQLVQWLYRGNVTDFSDMLIALTISVGILVTLVSGVGVLLEDYQPKVNTFWRSRPINPHMWFATKYLTGIIVLAAAFGPLPMALNWDSGWRYASPLETLGTIGLFLAIYTLSLTAYALVRQPIYAVILAMGSLWPLGLLDAGIAYELRDLLGDDLAAIVAGTFLVIAYVAVVVLAWQAVVRDWGWKQHR